MTLYEGDHVRITRGCRSGRTGYIAEFEFSDGKPVAVVELDDQEARVPLTMIEKAKEA